MGVFTQKYRIEELARELEREVHRRFREVARMSAEDIAEQLIEEKGLDDICRDIDEAISEAEDMIWEDADSNVLYDFDNYLLATFDPYPEREEVDFDVIKTTACSEETENVVGKAIQAYAFELWRAGIRNELRNILKEKCSKVGRLRRVISRVI